ncbi:MAG: hypothetical protein WAM66_00870 [Acidobacteriaceae bacterium]
MFCTVHCFLAEVALRAVVETSVADLTLISATPELDKGCLVIGTDRTIPTIPVNESVLLKARRTLRRGGSIIVIIDRSAGAPLEGNMLRLARSVGTRVVFGIPELKPNSEILVDYFIPPLFTSDESIQLSLETLRAERDCILKLPSSGSNHSVPNTRRAAPTGSAGRAPTSVV